MAQIVELMGQYLALGPQTPAYDIISQTMPAIEQAMGGGGMPPEGGMPPGMPPEAGGMPPMPEAPMMGGEVGMPDMTGGMPLEEQQTGDYGSFADANAALGEDIRKKIKAR